MQLATGILLSTGVYEMALNQVALEKIQLLLPTGPALPHL